MSADEDGWTVGDPAAEGTVAYDYADSLQDIPARAEVAADVARRAVAEFLETGRKPVGVELQELSPDG